MGQIILASASPRRKELFAGLGIGFEVRVISGIDESYPPELPLSEVPLYIAKEKAAAYDIADGELVIMHNPTTGGTCGTDIGVEDSTLAQLKELSADAPMRLLRECVSPHVSCSAALPSRVR